MIEFNENDFNLIKIKKESKLFNLATRYKYYVYGLRQAENPPVLVEFNFGRVNKGFSNKIFALKDFFENNGIKFYYWSDSDSPNIDIGLRKDLRGFMNKNKKPLLASSILQTIIYCLEDRIDLSQLKTFKLLALPKLTDFGA